PDALQQARIGLRARPRRAAHPSVEAARRDFQAAAHHPHGILAAAVLNRRVPLGDCFAKYAAASLKKSRSLVTFDSSRLRRAISSSRGVPPPGKALPPPASASRTQRVSRFGLTPTSRAIFRQLDCDRRTSSTSSRLYSGLKTFALRHGHSFGSV